MGVVYLHSCGWEVWGYDVVLAIVLNHRRPKVGTCLDYRIAALEFSVDTPYGLL